jgi:hypothetical protein
MRSGLLGRHDAGDAGGGEHVPLVVLTAQDQRQGRGGHGDKCLGASLTLGHLLVGHIHHVGFAALVEMGQIGLSLLGFIGFIKGPQRWETKLHGLVRASS